MILVTYFVIVQKKDWMLIRFLDEFLMYKPDIGKYSM